ncbi:hypothetical protein [Vallitalea guaymasensis]|uniref:hypothetical protein n=1 Tax=Vallitalea guaymasensis TaxID=1185412 RepID=UPI00129019C7|nr:hypothetical protein [Vallitalea guaymasensis]
MNKRLLVMLFLTIILVFSCSLKINAEVDSTSGSEQGKTKYLNKDLSIYDKQLWSPADIDTSESKPNFVENLLRGLCVSLGDQFIAGLNKVGMNLDYIVYGNIGSGNYTLPTFFKFHLGPNNIYGFVSANVYKIFRSFALIAMIFIYLKIIIEILTVGTARSRYNIKSSLGVYILTWLLLYQAPYIIDVFLYIRDYIQYLVMKVSFDAFGFNNGLSLIDSFRSLAVEEGASLSDALLYNGTIGLTFWFAFSYLGVALTQAILFGLFPVICPSINGNKTKVALNNWTKEWLSLSSIPIMDCVLLLFPMGFAKFGAPDLLTLFIAFLVIPSRGVIRRVLGLGSNLGLEMAGLGFAMGAFGMARTGVRGIKNLTNRGSGAMADRSMSKMHSQMANIEEQSTPDMNQSMNMNAGGLAGASVPPMQPPLQDVDYMHNMSKQAPTNMTQYATSNPYSDSISREKAEVMKSFANYKNFDNQEFAAHLSHREKADFYKKRARYNGIKVATSAVGAGLGGLAGFSTTTFMSTGHKTMATMGGALLGGAAGNAVGSAAVGIMDNHDKINNYGQELGQRIGSFFRTDKNESMDVNNQSNIKFEITPSDGLAVGETYKSPIERYGNDINRIIKNVSEDPDVNFNTHVVQSGVYDNMMDKIIENVGEPTQADKAIINLESIKQGCNYKANVIAKEVMKNLNIHAGDPSMVDINKYIQDTVNSMTVSDLKDQAETFRNLNDNEGVM